MIAVADEEGADKIFGGREVAFAKKTRGRDDVGRNCLEFRRVRGCHLPLRRVTDHLVKPFEHAP